MEELNTTMPQYNLTGNEKIKFYEREIPKYRERLRYASFEARKRLMQTIDEMEKGLLEERDKLRENSHKRRKWMWWR